MRRASARRYPNGTKAQEGSAATKSVPESALDGRESTLHRLFFDQYAPALWSSSFQGQSADIWKDPVHGAMVPTEARQQDKESNCESFSFHTSYEFLRTTFCTVATFLVAATMHRLGKILCRVQANIV